MGTWVKGFMVSYPFSFKRRTRIILSIIDCSLSIWSFLPWLCHTGLWFMHLKGVSLLYALQSRLPMAWEVLHIMATAHPNCVHGDHHSSLRTTICCTLFMVIALAFWGPTHLHKVPSASVPFLILFALPPWKGFWIYTSDSNFLNIST